MRSLTRVLSHHSDAGGNSPKETMEKEEDERNSLFKISRCVLMVAYIGYCLMGAKIFQTLETDVHEELRISTWKAKEDLMKNYANITPEELEIFLQKLTFSVKSGIFPLKDRRYISWNFKNSFLFALSTLATIGYGTITPKTPDGQIFCVFYALLGIPQTIIFLNYLGNVLSWPFLGLRKYLQDKGLEKRRMETCMFFFFLVIGLLIFILLPPLFFMNVENWTYKEGVYFAFITLTTIGFGDYVIGMEPPENYPPAFPLAITLWYIFGLAWVSLLFNLFIKISEEN